MNARSRWKLLIGLNFLLIAVLPVWAQEKTAAAATWEPATTRAFIVSLAKFQDDHMPSFSTDERLDDRFVALLEQRGVPRNQIVYLKDGRATTAAIQAEFNRCLQQSKPGETLFFYYGSHGGYNAETGKCWFVSYDHSVAFDWVFDAIEQHFKGSQALLTSDCCHSGGINDLATRRKSKIAYACLSSTYTHQTAWSGWRFMQCLMRGLEGNPVVDPENRGYVDLAGLADYTERYMAFVAEGKPQFTTTGGFDRRLRLAKTSARHSEPVGDLVEVSTDDGWKRAEVLAAKGDQLRIHFTKDTRTEKDEWVAKDEVREPDYPEYAVGQRVDLQGSSSKKWFPGKVTDTWESMHFGRYDGFSPAYDEWFGPSRIRPAFDGSWVGRWRNNLDQHGEDSLVLKTKDREFFVGTWSGNVAVSVERLGRQMFLLEAQVGDKKYRGAGRIEEQTLFLDYAARDAREHYFGWAVFQTAGEVPAPERDEAAELAGSWEGTYENSLGGQGKDTLKLVEEKGALSGVWSGVKVTGERLGNASFYLTGRNRDVTYHVVGHVEDEELTLGYSATSEQKRYTGQVTLESSD